MDPAVYEKALLRHIRASQGFLLRLDGIGQKPLPADDRFFQTFFGFGEKVYVYKIPENCRIFVTYSDIKENPIEEEVYSFMAHI